MTPPSPNDNIPVVGWVLLAMLLVSGLMTLIAMTRAGIRTLWAQPERSIPRVSIVEITPIAVLLLISVTLTVQAEPAMRYMRALAQDVHAPNGYVHGVLAQPAQPAAKAEGGRP